MTKTQLEGMIADMRKNLLDTKNNTLRGRDPVNEAVYMMIPIFEDQLAIIQGMLDLMESTDG